MVLLQSIWLLGLLHVVPIRSISREFAPFQTWTLSKAKLTTATENPYAVYDESFDPESIWILGGLQCYTCMSRYNISNDSLSTYDILDTGGHTYSKRSSVLIDGNIYSKNIYIGEIYI